MSDFVNRKSRKKSFASNVNKFKVIFFNHPKMDGEGVHNFLH